MTHIVLVSPTLGAGGAERTVIALANNLAMQRDYRLTLVVASTRGDKGRLKPEVCPAVELVDFDCDRVVNLMRMLPAWLSKTSPDVLISSQTHTNIMCYFAAKWAGFKGRLIVREVSTPSINLKHLTRLKKTALQVLMRYVYRRASHVVTVSHGVADDLERYLRVSLPHMRVIYNPVVSPSLYERAQEELLHPWFVDERSCPVMLAVGRLNQAKDYQLLIHAFAEVVQIKPVRLMILGEGEERASLEQMVRDLNLEAVVSLQGFDPNPFRYMARCDLYVMSSRWEGLPGALIQAMALGASVISTDCPSGPREILQDGRLGVLVPSGNVEAMRMAIITVLDQAAVPDIHAMAANVLPYTAETTMSQYMSLFVSSHE